MERPDARLHARGPHLTTVHVLVLAVAAAVGVVPPVTAQSTPDAATPPLAAAAPQMEVASDTLLTLQGAMGLLRGHNPNYRAALARADLAGESVWQAWGAWLPTVTARASFNSSDFTRRTAVDDFGRSQELADPIEVSSKTTFQALDFSWLAFDGMRRAFDTGASAADARAASLTARAELVRLESEVETAYYEALKQREQARLARELLAARLRDLEVARERFRIAAVAQTDVLQAEIEVNRQELAALVAGQAAAAARRELAALLGLEEGADYALRDESEIVDPAGIRLDDLAAAARRSHPALARRAAEVEAREKSLWAARGSWLPDVTLGLTLSRSENLGPEGDFFTLDPRDSGTDFRVTFSWPLLNGLQKKYETGRESARLAEARQLRRAEAIRIERDVRNLYGELETRYRAYEIQGRNVERARELVRMSTERYRIGAASIVELRQATDRETEAERGLIEARYEFMKTLARLKAAVGAPLPPSQRN